MSSPDPTDIGMREVKYSLRELLSKAEQERRQSSLAREMVDQGEIREFFKTRRKEKKRRAKP